MTVIAGLVLALGVVVVMFGFVVTSPADLTLFEAWTFASMASSALFLFVAIIQSMRRRA